jgi:glutamate 5-kinase
MSKLGADVLVILTDVDGLYDDDPRINPHAKVIPVVTRIDEQIEALGFDASQRGKGGMKTKIEAAKIAVHSGGMAVIANGKKEGTINKIFDGEETGTLFIPIEQLSSRKRWIAYASNITGVIMVNEGAKEALIQKNASLLPSGIVNIKNDFEKNDVISIADENGKEFARGMANYSSEDAKQLIGKKTGEIKKILGHKESDEIVNRDNIVIL